MTRVVSATAADSSYLNLFLFFRGGWYYTRITFHLQSTKSIGGCGKVSVYRRLEIDSRQKRSKKNKSVVCVMCDSSVHSNRQNECVCANVESVWQKGKRRMAAHTNTLTRFWVHVLCVIVCVLVACASMYGVRWWWTIVLLLLSLVLWRCIVQSLCSKLAWSTAECVMFVCVSSVEHSQYYGNWSGCYAFSSVS